MNEWINRSIPRNLSRRFCFGVWGFGGIVLASSRMDVCMCEWKREEAEGLVGGIDYSTMSERGCRE